MKKKRQDWASETKDEKLQVIDVNEYTRKREKSYLMIVMFHLKRGVESMNALFDHWQSS